MPYLALHPKRDEKREIVREQWVVIFKTAFQLVEGSDRHWVDVIPEEEGLLIGSKVLAALQPQNLGIGSVINISFGTFKLNQIDASEKPQGFLYQTSVAIRLMESQSNAVAIGMKSILRQFKRSEVSIERSKLANGSELYEAMEYRCVEDDGAPPIEILGPEYDPDAE